MATRESSTPRSRPVAIVSCPDSSAGSRRRRSTTRPRKSDFGQRLPLGPRPEPLWRRVAFDSRTLTEAVFTEVCPDPTHPQPAPRHFVLDLFINHRLRDTRVFHHKQEALTQGMAWFRQFESPYHRLALRLHVPDAIAARGTLGVRLPVNGQGLVCELFTFHDGQTWQVLINADGRPLLTREYRTEEAACLDAWSLAWKLQGHALPWPAHWLPTPSIARKAMERYDRVPTLSARAARPRVAAAHHASVHKPAAVAATAAGAAAAAVAAAAHASLRQTEHVREADAVSEEEGLAGATPAERLAIQPFRLLYFAPPPRKVTRAERPMPDF